MIQCECGLEIYGPEDAQNYLGVSRHALNRYRNEGWLGSMGAYGRGFLYSKAELDKCIVYLDKDRRNKEVYVA